MMLDLLAAMLAAALGGVVGVLLHEVSHWVVLRATGRARGVAWDRSGRVVTPQVIFARPEESVPVAVRVAAAAPLPVGVVVAVGVAVLAVSVGAAGVAAAVGVLIGCGRLSPADRAVALGRSRDND